MTDAANGDRVIADQIAYYRARAPEYDETFRGSHDSHLVAALARIRPSGDVLELACGTGAWTEALIRHPARAIHCVDAAPEMLAFHERRIRDERVTRETADLFTWTPERRYDLVTFAFWLSHVPPARFEAFWRTVERSVAPRGEVFFVDEDERGLAFEHPDPDEDYPTVERQLRDGRTMKAIKVYHRASALRDRLRRLGWEATVTAVGERFLWGRAIPPRD